MSIITNRQTRTDIHAYAGRHKGVTLACSLHEQTDAHGHTRIRLTPQRRTDMRIPLVVGKSMSLVVNPRTLFLRPQHVMLLLPHQSRRSRPSRRITSRPQRPHFPSGYLSFFSYILDIRRFRYDLRHQRLNLSDTVSYNFNFPFSRVFSILTSTMSAPVLNTHLALCRRSNYFEN